MTEEDKKISMLFSSIFLFFVAINIISILTGDSSPLDLIEGLFVSLFISLGITGILAFKYYRKNAIIPTKQLLKWFAVIALGVAAVAMLLVIFIANAIPDIPSNIGFLIMIILILYGIMFLITLIIMMALFCFAFGMVGVLSALVRTAAPDILFQVSRLSTDRSAGKVIEKKNTESNKSNIIIGWAFAVPDVLETKTITINEGRPRNYFPWSNLYKAIFWQLLFGTVIIIYISFNPLYVKSELDFRNLFAIASNFTIIVPFIILPWFIFLRLDAKIKGQVKDYRLYSGIVYRMYQTFFTLGTIIIIIRLGLEEIDSKVILFALPTYYLFFMFTITLVTYTYFNYFENGLAWEIAKSYNKIKD